MIGMGEHGLSRIDDRAKPSMEAAVVNSIAKDRGTEATGTPVTLSRMMSLVQSASCSRFVRT